MSKVTVLYSVFSLLLTSSASAECISGYSLIASDIGVEMCADGDDVVQIIDLTKGAKLQFLFEKDGDKFKPQYISDFWSELENKQANAFSVVNGTFFAAYNNDYSSTEPAQIAFLLKSNGVVATKGYYNQDDYIYRKTLKLTGETATIDDDLNYSYIDGYPDALGGLSTSADKHNSWPIVGRTLIGINDSGKKIYILVSDGMMVSSAEEILNNFGATKVMMLDGSGSAQLISSYKTIIGDDGGNGRLIPQAIGIIAGGNAVSRAEALKLIIDKFKISKLNNGFNNTLFGEPITIPRDVNSSTLYYDYIVTAYNKGIAKGSGGYFSPTDNVKLSEFITMIVRAIPIPLDNPDYYSYPYNNGQWYDEYVTAAFNAGLIDNQNYNFEDYVDSSFASDILSRAYNYFLGDESGISIYAKWNKKYADIDLYLYSPYDGNYKDIEYDNDYRVTNIGELKNSGGIVYWNKHSSDWGANLDYDSWGGNAEQPWAGVGEERVTVDSLQIRRPAKYSIILCYYNWNRSYNPADANIEWWGINAGRNINVGGENFNTTVKLGECVYSGTLNTY